MILRDLYTSFGSDRATLFRLFFDAANHGGTHTAILASRDEEEIAEITFDIFDLGEEYVADYSCGIDAATGFVTVGPLGHHIGQYIDLDDLDED